jgi:hypothetical protein
MMIETTAGRVPSNTARDVNLDIKEAFRASVAYFTEHPTAIPDRLKALDREWDIERALAAASSGLSLLGLAGGFSGRRRGYLLSLVVQGFYMQHTLQGWCPPLPLLRRMGFRTASEIERERCALKDILREDNAELTQSGVHHPAEKFAVLEKDSSRPV